MPIEFYLARRYLLDRRHGAWGWLISWLSTGSVAIGVAALIVTLAVMTGFRQDIQEKLQGVQPHVVVMPAFGDLNPSDPLIPQKIEADSNLLAWSPFISGQVLVGRGSSTSGVVLKGIVPSKEVDVVNLKKKLVEGEWGDLLPAASAPNSKPGLILGQELARSLGAHLGSQVWVMTPGSEGFTPLSIPKAHLFNVVGLLKTGLYDYDSSMGYIALEEAQNLFQMNKMVSGIGIRIKNPDDSVAVAKSLQVRFEGKYWVRSWLSLNQNLFSALKLEKTVMFIILTLVTLVASFMIVSNLLLIITQKIKEIGILRAMGATSRTIQNIFLLQGVLMGVIGNIIGVVLGVGISLVLAHTNFIKLPADVYYIDNLPIKIDPLDILAVVAAASLIVLLASLYPARRAAKLDPLDAIRYG